MSNTNWSIGQGRERPLAFYPQAKRPRHCIDIPSGSDQRAIGMGGWHHIPLPPNASPTLFVEGIPATCSRREVSHIFRPFLGYKDVRLVTKESRHSGGGRLVLCFVDFQTPAQAATAMDALQAKDVLDWSYRGEGAVNLVLSYCGNSPNFVTNSMTMNVTQPT